MKRINDTNSDTLDKYTNPECSQGTRNYPIMPRLVSFRNLIPKIKSTTYLTHSIYSYPAKFIPQVVRYCIDKYTEKGGFVIDPFAGSGTAAVEAYLCNRDSFLLDINPILNYLIPVKVYTGKEKLSFEELNYRIDHMWCNDTTYLPDWPTVEDWYPPAILDKLSRYWGWVKSQERDIYTLILESALIKITKSFSYADDSVPKLFRSKSKKARVNELVLTDWERKMDEKLTSVCYKTVKSINEFIEVSKNSNAQVTYHGGVDSTIYDYKNVRPFDLLITSPPYLQAQEYIRSSKMELFWLGYNDKDIKEFTKLEIPYRPPSRTIHTGTLDNLRSLLDRKDLINTLDSYFSLTINALECAMNNMKNESISCIFIGNPTIDGNTVEIWRIFKEYFEEFNYTTLDVFEDVIKGRQLFGYRKNKNPDGMKSEFLLVLKKND